MGITFDFSDFDRGTEDMSKAVQNKTIDKALDAGAKPIVKYMDRNVAVDTGVTKDSLGELRKEGSGTDRKILLGVTSDDRDVVERAYYDEYGTELQVARHWLKKSFEQGKKEAEEAIIAKLKEELGL